MVAASEEEAASAEQRRKDELELMKENANSHGFALLTNVPYDGDYFFHTLVTVTKECLFPFAHSAEGKFGEVFWRRGRYMLRISNFG